MSREQAITELLGLQGVEVVPGGVTITDDELVLELVHEAGSGFVCGSCGESCLLAYDYLAARRIRDFPVFGKRCTLVFGAARVWCGTCGVKREALKWIEPKSRQTLRYERYVAALCGVLPALDVAELEGLDKSTVYRLDRKWLGRREAQREFKPVRYLGIDEIAIRKNHRYATVFYDLERREVIGLVKERKQRAVGGFFRRWGKAMCSKVVAVCTDLWAPYHNSVKRHLKQAVLVFDKFHVYGYLSKAIDTVRREEQERCKQSQKKLIKGTRWLWLKHPDKLRRKQKQQLDEIMELNKNLHKAYLLKEAFEGFYECETRQEAQEFLEDWTKQCEKSGLMPFKDLARRLKRWQQGILAYFVHPITNGIAEGINNKIKVLKRRSYGFRDFIYFALKVIDSTGGLPPLNAITHT